MIAFNLVILCVAIFLLLNLPKSIKQKDIQPMSRESTGVIRGAAIIGIVIHHFSQYYDGLGPFQNVVQQSGYWITAVFFFMSGFGCYYSISKLEKLTTNGEKIKSSALWFLKHSLRIYFDFLIVFVLNIILFKAMGISEGTSLKDIIKGVVTITQPHWTSWYPKIQILCYAILVFTFLIAKKHKELATAIIVVIYMAATYKLGFASMWFSSVFCFPMGLYFAKYNKQISNFNIGVKWAGLIVSAGGFLALFYLQQSFHQDVVRTVSAMLIPFALYFLTSVYSFNSKVLTTIGNWSFEIYLIHLAIIRAFMDYDINSNLALVITIATSLILGYGVNFVVVKINSKIFENKKIKKV